MSNSRDERLFLENILESIRAIESYIVDLSFDDFVADRKTFSATIREFEIIGEAVANISEETKGRFPDILWKQMKAFRNKLIHEYFGVDARIVWDAARNELPEVKRRVIELLSSCPG